MMNFNLSITKTFFMDFRNEYLAFLFLLIKFILTNNKICNCYKMNQIKILEWWITFVEFLMNQLYSLSIFAIHSIPSFNPKPVKAEHFYLLK